MTASSTCAVQMLLESRYSRRGEVQGSQRLQRHAERRLAVRVARYADDAAGKLALELVLRREERGMRTAVAERHAEALRVADADVGAPLARRRQQHEAHEIGGDGDHGTGGVRAITELSIVEHRAVARRILDQRAEHVVADGRRPPIAHHDIDAADMRARANDVDRLRMAFVGNEEGLLARLAAAGVRHRHRFGGGRALVEQRRVRDLEPGEILHHRLKRQQRFQPSLRNLGLIRRVRRVPAGILENIALDHRRRERS